MKAKLKNVLLLTTYLLGHLPSMFYGMVNRYDLSLFVARSERGTRIDFIALYYSWSITFLILAFLLLYPKGLDKRIVKFIFIVAVLDFLHLALFAMQGFGMAKFGIAMIFIFAPEILYLIRSLTRYLKKLCLNLMR